MGVFSYKTRAKINTRWFLKLVLWSVKGTSESDDTHCRGNVLIINYTETLLHIFGDICFFCLKLKWKHIYEKACAICWINLFLNIYLLVQHELFPFIFIWFTHFKHNSSATSYINHPSLTGPSLQAIPLKKGIYVQRKK